MRSWRASLANFGFCSAVSSCVAVQLAALARLSGLILQAKFSCERGTFSAALFHAAEGLSAAHRGKIIPTVVEPTTYPIWFLFEMPAERLLAYNKRLVDKDHMRGG